MSHISNYRNLWNQCQLRVKKCNNLTPITELMVYGGSPSRKLEEQLTTTNDLFSRAFQLRCGGCSLFTFNVMEIGPPTNTCNRSSHTLSLHALMRMVFI